MIWISAPLSRASKLITTIIRGDQPEPRAKISAIGASLAASSTGDTAKTDTLASARYSTVVISNVRMMARGSVRSTAFTSSATLTMSSNPMKA